MLAFLPEKGQENGTDTKTPRQQQMILQIQELYSIFSTRG